MRAFQEAVWARCGARPDDPFHEGICERCGQVRPLHAHHRKTNPRVHDPKHGNGLCARCHIFDIHGHGAEDWHEWFDPDR